MHSRCRHRCSICWVFRGTTRILSSRIGLLNTATRTHCIWRVRKSPTCVTKIVRSTRRQHLYSNGKRGFGSSAAGHLVVCQGNCLFSWEFGSQRDRCSARFAFRSFRQTACQSAKSVLYKPETRVLLLDRSTWIQRLFDQSTTQYATYAPLREMVLGLRKEADVTGQTLSTADLKRRIGKVQRTVEELLAGPISAD